MAPEESATFTDWLAGANRVRGAAEMRSRGAGLTMVRAVLEPEQDRPEGAAGLETFPALTVQMTTRGRLPFSADMGVGRFEAVSGPGDFIVTPPNQGCTFTTGASFESLGLALSWTLVETLAAPAYDGRLPDLSPLYAGLFGSSQVGTTLQVLWTLAAAPDTAAGRLLMHGEVLKLLGELLSLTAPSAPRTPGRLSGAQLARACEALASSCEEKTTLAEVASHAGLSPSHFSRAFKRTTGSTPSAWLLHLRLERAKELLRDRRMGLAEIALATGFASQPHFTTAFRRRVGTPPGAWRRAADA